MTLTQQQLKQFDQDGFLLLRGFLSQERTEELRKHIQLLIQKAEPPIETEERYHDLDENGPLTLRRLRQVYDRDPLIAEWMCNMEIRPILTALLHDTPVLTLAHHNSIMTKMPSEISNTCWHQDRRYWDFQNDDLLSIWLALGEERLENGLLEFIPGSHKLEFDADQFDAKVCFRDDLDKNSSILAKRVHFDLHPGDIVLFHCRTLHYAQNNQTDEPKIALVYTVRAKSNLPVTGTRSARHPEIELS